LVLGACSWQSVPVDSSSLRNMVARTPTLVPKDGEWSVYFLGFAQSGWSAEAREFAKELSGTEVAGENWRSVGIRLLDLDQLDKDLARWSEAAKHH